MKKIYIVILSNLLIFSFLLVGCGDNTRVDTSIEDNPKITYWSSFSPGVLAATPEESLYYQTIKEKTGVNIEYISNDGGAEQLSILAAADDLPDIVETLWTNFPGGSVFKALADGLIIPINDLMNDGYTPNFKKYLESDPEVDKLCKNDNGEYFAFPMIRKPDSNLVFTGFMIREDWLNDLNLEVPKTIDDWENVLTAFKEKKGATCAFSSCWASYNILANTFNVFQDFYAINEKIVKYGPLERGYQEYIKTLNRWYEKGLVDADIFSQNPDTVYAKISTGKIGALTGYTGATFSNIEKLKTNDTKLNFIPVSYPVKGEGGKFNIDVSVYRVNELGSAITSNCKHPEIAAKVVDYVYSKEGDMLANFGIEGKSYNMVNGYPKYTEIITDNPDGYSFLQAMELYCGNCNKPFLVDKRYNEQYFSLEQQQRSLGVWNEISGDIKQLPLLALTSEESQEYASLYNEIKTYVDENKMQFILGTQSIDEKYEEFISNIKKMGIERCIEIQQNALDRFNAR